MNTRCRSCGAAILWARTERGKAMPFDAAPVELGTPPLGTFVIDGHARAPRPEDVGRDRFRSHFATCPDAAQHRRPR